MKTGGDSHTRSNLQGGLEARRKQTPEDGCGGRGTCSLNFSIRHRCGQETVRLAGRKDLGSVRVGMLTGRRVQQAEAEG